MFTGLSDGEKLHAEIAHDAIAAGLDFIVVTDHNVYVTGVEGYYENGSGKRVLLMTGEEVHNVRRQPQASHFLAYGAGKELARYAPDPQALIDETLGAGGYGFLAHPHEEELALIDSPDLGWHDWDIEGFSGLEIWNYMSVFKNVVARRLAGLRWRNKLTDSLVGLWMTLHPERYMDGADAKTLALWDEFLARGMRVTAIGNSGEPDHGSIMLVAHQAMVSFGNVTVTPLPVGPFTLNVDDPDNGNIIVTPNKATYTYGERVTIRAQGQGNIVGPGGDAQHGVAEDVVADRAGTRGRPHDRDRLGLEDGVQLGRETVVRHAKSSHCRGNRGVLQGRD